MSRRPLPRNVHVLSWVSLAQDAASELLYPILPLFLTVTLGAPAGVVGVIEGTADGAAALTKLWAGRLADRRRRKPLVAWGYGIAGFAKFLVAVAVAWPMVLVARVIDRFGKGLRGAPRDVLLAEEVDAPDRGRAFGFHRAMDTAGAVVGPLVALGLLTLFDNHIRPVLLFAVAPALASVALVGLVRERAVPVIAHASEVAGPLGSAFWRAVTPIALFSAVNFPDGLLLVRASRVGLGARGVIGVYCLFNAVYALGSYPAGAVSDRVPRKWLMVLGTAVFAVVYAGLGVVDHAAAVVALFGVYGIYRASTDGVGKAWISELVSPRHRGRALGLHQAVEGLGVLVAGLWAGVAWHGSGHGPLLVAGAVAGAAALMLAVVGPTRATS